MRYPIEEDRRVAAILVKILAVVTLALGVIALMEVVWQDWFALLITLAGILAQAIPWALLARGRLQAGGVAAVLADLAIVTVVSTIGNGIHDLAVVAYPVILVIASLLLSRRNFYLVSGLTVTAMAWLVLGESAGIYASRPYAKPDLVDLVIVLAVIGTAILAVDWLAENLRENIRRAQQEIAQRKTMEALVRHQSIHDALTGIYNRAFFEEELARLESGAEHPLSIIIADVDNLKTVNDTQGHASGDAFIRRAAAALHAVFRENDILARIGGDEFAVLLPHTDAAMAEHMLARVQARLAEDNRQHPDLPLWMSLGAATVETGSLSGVFSEADRRMYAEKAARKNKARNL